MDEFVEVNEISYKEGINIKLPCTIRMPKNLLYGNERMVWFYVIKELCKKIEVQNG